MKKRVLWLILLVVFTVFITSSCEDATASDTSSEDTVEGLTENETEATYAEIPKLAQDELPFTIELTKTDYTRSSDKIYFRIKSKEPGGYFTRGDKWRLYSIENDKAALIGEISWEIALEYAASSDDEYIVRDEYMLIKTLCGKENLSVGKYCLVFIVQAPDDNGYYHTYSGATMYFEIVE